MDVGTDQPHKLIFLDVDGVLNNKHARQILQNLVVLLGGLIRGVHADIVLSSMWRLKKKNRERVKEALLRARLPLPISCTPYILHLSGWKNVRVNEVLSWLQMNTTLNFKDVNIVRDTLHNKSGNFEESDYMLPSKINVSDWVVIDDIDMHKFGGEFRSLVSEHHFVLTLMKTGITKENIEQARYILTGGKEGAMVPEKCEHCMVVDVAGHDKEINKYFCHDDCQKGFHLTYQLSI
jgi:hypothetical protein